MGASAILVSFAFEPELRLGIWTGLAAAWVAQLAAFGALLAAARREARLLVAGWSAGTVARLAAIAGLAGLILGGVVALPIAPTLIALVAALFVLLLLEPAIFRYGFAGR